MHCINCPLQTKNYLFSCALSNQIKCMLNKYLELAYITFIIYQSEIFFLLCNLINYIYNSGEIDYIAILKPPSITAKSAGK